MTRDVIDRAAALRRESDATWMQLGEQFGYHWGHLRRMVLRHHPVGITRRQQRAGELRAQGRSYQQIADELDYYSATAARRAVLNLRKREGPS